MQCLSLRCSGFRNFLLYIRITRVGSSWPASPYPRYLTSLLRFGYSSVCSRCNERSNCHSGSCATFWLHGYYVFRFITSVAKHTLTRLVYKCNTHHCIHCREASICLLFCPHLGSGLSIQRNRCYSSGYTSSSRKYIRTSSFPSMTCAGECGNTVRSTKHVVIFSFSYRIS